MNYENVHGDNNKLTEKIDEIVQNSTEIQKNMMIY